jgi:hypothetical protein
MAVDQPAAQQVQQQPDVQTLEPTSRAQQRPDWAFHKGRLMWGDLKPFESIKVRSHRVAVIGPWHSLATGPQCWHQSFEAAALLLGVTYSRMASVSCHAAHGVHLTVALTYILIVLLSDTLAMQSWH